MRKETINVAVYSTHGNPADVLRIESQPWPRPGADEVVVEMQAAPINPADLNAIEGKYPGKREVPAVPGFEGSGIVSELGKNVSKLTIGSLVILPHDIGTWREACAVKAKQLVVVPSGVDPVQAAMLKINPLTAWRLLHGYVALKAGDWVIQNAANSAAGRAVIQIAHALGYKTVNVVRREELIEELRTEGGDVVLIDGENVRDELSGREWHTRNSRRDECAAVKNSERAAYFQRSAFPRHLDQQVVRQRNGIGPNGSVQSDFRNGGARVTANESRKIVSPERNKNGS